MMGRLAMLLIRGYQLTFAAVLGGQCRFYPTCSAYCSQAIEAHGLGHGLMLSVRPRTSNAQSENCMNTQKLDCFFPPTGENSSATVSR